MEDFENYLKENDEDFPVRSSDFNESLTMFKIKTGNENIRFINGQIRSIEINFNIRGLEGRSFQLRDDIFEYYQKIVDDIRQKYPRGISTCFQIPEDQWANLSLEQSLFKNNIAGMATSILFAWIVLLISTKNYWVSLQAALSILLVIATIISSIYLQGWSLGMAESIGLIVFVGFSVDYIVHMCHQYIESIHDKRKKKVDTCFQRIGSTILNGAATSFMAGVFLDRC